MKKRFYATKNFIKGFIVFLLGFFLLEIKHEAKATEVKQEPHTHTEDSSSQPLEYYRFATMTSSTSTMTVSTIFMPKIK